MRDPEIGAAMLVDVPCPSCRHQGIEYTTTLLEVPYFKEVVATQILCSQCGYRHNDIFIVSDEDPIRYTYKIKDMDDMSVRVIRSTSGTFEVPELGIKVEPGGASEAFITNIEGVLARMGSAVLSTIRFNKEEQPELVEKAQNIIDKIHQIKDGEAEATLIMMDPNGNSAILPPDEKLDQLEKKALTKQECEELPKGYTTVPVPGEEPTDELPEKAQEPEK